MYFVSIKLLESASENFHGKQKRRYGSTEGRMKDEITPLLIQMQLKQNYENNGKKF